MPPFWTDANGLENLRWDFIMLALSAVLTLWSRSQDACDPTDERTADPARDSSDSLPPRRTFLETLAMTAARRPFAFVQHREDPVDLPLPETAPEQRGDYLASLWYRDASGRLNCVWRRRRADRDSPDDRLTEELT